MLKLINSDCVAAMKDIPDCSVDSIVTDPPYELGFMGKKWDSTGIAYSVEMWKQCLRVLKPGGHLLAFSGSRTYHRMTVAIEDAGFDIRDQIMWVYGSGFPKSMDVSKAIDKAGGDALAWRAFSEEYAKAVRVSHMTHSDIDRELGIKSSSCYWARTDHRGGMPPRHHWERVRDLLALSDDFVRLYDEAEREVIGQRFINGQEGTAGGYKNGIASIRGADVSCKREIDITAPATDAAKQWQGWGTALKPAHEPICVARKPLIGTVAANVLSHGTGALNIDGCRVGDDTGRWPANLIHDGSEEVTDRMGEPARFFYCAKASNADREAGNNHPTVKPTELMRYLCRLVTPPNGIVLDPFMGSGSTGKAAKLEGFGFIGIEQNKEYIDIASSRIDAAKQEIVEQRETMELFA
jgi:DNA modification methylase